MPLTKKGQKILRSMRKQYGERGEEVFYRSARKGTISGVEKGASKGAKRGGGHGRKKAKRKH